MKISELYGKKVISENGARTGYVLGVCPLKTAIGWLICCDESERTFFISGKDAKFYEEFISYKRAEKAQKNAAQLRLGRAVYSETGKFLGSLEDCVVKGGEIKNAVIGGKKYPFGRLIIGDAVIVRGAKQAAELAAKDMFIEAVCAE